MRGLGVEEGCRNARLASGGRLPESEAWKWRKGAGKLGLGVEEGCRNARLGSGGRVPECEAWSVKNSDSKQPSVRLLVPCLPPMRLFLISQSTALPRWNTADAENLTPSAEDQDPAKIRSLL